MSRNLTDTQESLMTQTETGPVQTDTIVAVLNVLANSRFYHWLDEDGDDGDDNYVIVRLDLKMPADDVWPESYTAYWCIGEDEDEPIYPQWCCDDAWLSLHADDEVNPWEMPIHLWAQACADDDSVLLRPMKATKRRYAPIRPIAPLFPRPHPPLRQRRCDPPVEPEVTSAAPYPGLQEAASRDKEIEASQRTTPPPNAPAGDRPLVPIEAGQAEVDDPFQAWRESWHHKLTRHKSEN